MINAGNLKGKTRQMSDRRRRLIALVSAFMLLISSSGITAFADDSIYSVPVTVPGQTTATPAPENPEETVPPAEGETGNPEETTEIRKLPMASRAGKPCRRMTKLSMKPAHWALSWMTAPRSSSTPLTRRFPKGRS